MPDNQPAPVAAPPNDELANKQAQLKDAQQKIAALNQTVISLQEDIKTLSQKAAEIKQATAGYDTLQQSMQKELADDQAQIKKLSDIAQAVLKDTVKQIDSTIADFDKNLKAGDDNVSALAEKAKKATAESSTADADVQTKQATYDDLKNGTAINAPKYNQAALKDIATLLASMAKAEGQTDFVAVYFLASEAKKKADAITILSPDDYSTKLKNAQSDLETSKATAKDKKKAADDVGAAYSAATQAQRAKWQSRISDLLAKLKGIGQKAA